MDIGLVSCTKSKRDAASKPRFLYSPSAYFKKASTYAQQEHDEWYILSAKYGLLEPDGPEIEPYDSTLSDYSTSKQESWARKIFESLSALDLLSEENTLVIHAGADYYETLVPLLDDAGIDYQIPTKGLRFGEKLAWYNEHLDESRGNRSSESESSQ